MHGIFCNRAVWWRLRRRLLAWGYGPVLAMSLPRRGGSVDAQSAELAHPSRPPLVRVVTIGTPRHGSVPAWLRATGACRGLRPGSAWLQARASTARSSPVPATSIYSLDDSLVARRASASWPAAHNVGLQGAGHFGLLATRRGIEVRLDAIRTPQ